MDFYVKIWLLCEIVRNASKKTSISACERVLPTLELKLLFTENPIADGHDSKIPDPQ